MLRLIYRGAIGQLGVTLQDTYIRIYIYIYIYIYDVCVYIHTYVWICTWKQRSEVQSAHFNETGVLSDTGQPHLQENAPP